MLELKQIPSLDSLTFGKIIRVLSGNILLVLKLNASAQQQQDGADEGCQSSQLTVYSQGFIICTGARRMKIGLFLTNQKTMIFFFFFFLLKS